jgi:hypothetical protein
MYISNRLHNDKHVVTSALKLAEGPEAGKMFIKCILLTKKHNLPQKAMGSHSKSKQAVCGNIHMRSQANSSWRKEKPEAEADGKSIAMPSKVV